MMLLFGIILIALMIAVIVSYRRRHRGEMAEPEWWEQFERDFREYARAGTTRRPADRPSPQERRKPNHPSAQ